MSQQIQATPRPAEATLVSKAQLPRLRAQNSSSNNAFG